MAAIQKSEKRLKERDEAKVALIVVQAEVELMHRALGRCLKSEKDLYDNLTATQRRCTELLDETRALKRELALRPERSTKHDEVL